MSFRCVLTIMDYSGKKSMPKEQPSPLCFKTDEECLDFGRTMFEPPKIVLGWRVKETAQPTKFLFKDGKVRW